MNTNNKVEKFNVGDTVTVELEAIVCEQYIHDSQKDKTAQLVSVELLDEQVECFVPYDKVSLRLPAEPQGLGAIVEVDSHADSGWPTNENSKGKRKLTFVRVALPSPGYTGMEKEWSDGEENVSWTEAVGSGNVIKIISEGILREDLS